MRFDWTITLGTIIQLVTMIPLAIGFFIALMSRLNSVQAMLKTHTEALSKHDSILQIYEGRIFTMVADIQKLIGKFEILAMNSFQSKES